MNDDKIINFNNYGRKINFDDKDRIYICVYTDSFKINNTVGFAFVVYGNNNKEIYNRKVKLNNEATAELTSLKRWQLQKL